MQYRADKTFYDTVMISLVFCDLHYEWEVGWVESSDTVILPSIEKRSMSKPSCHLGDFANQ